MRHVLPADAGLGSAARALRDAAETVQLNAAYALGAVGVAAVPTLLEALDDAEEGPRLAAAYGLSAVGAAAVPALLQVLDHARDHVRGFAAYALGEIGAAAGEGAVEALAGMVGDSSEWVRRNVAEALGTPHWDLVYQSRSGRPDHPWLEPDVCDHLRALHAAGNARQRRGWSTTKLSWRGRRSGFAYTGICRPRPHPQPWLPPPQCRRWPRHRRAGVCQVRGRSSGPLEGLASWSPWS